MNEWMNEWMDKWMDEWMNESVWENKHNVVCLVMKHNLIGIDAHYTIVVHMYNINVSTELEMTSDAWQNGRKARYVKHCQVRVTSDTQKDSVFWLAQMTLYIMA